MTPEEVMLQLMENYNQTVSKWQGQIHDMDTAFVQGDFRSHLQNEIQSFRDGLKEDDDGSTAE